MRWCKENPDAAARDIRQRNQELLLGRKMSYDLVRFKARSRTLAIDSLCARIMNGEHKVN